MHFLRLMTQPAGEKHEKRGENMNWITQKTTRGLGYIALVFMASSCAAPAAPDYNTIGRQFSEVLQNSHFSRERFSASLYAKFLDCYLQSIDPQHLYFTQEDVNALHKKYGDSFGDYLLNRETSNLAQELYGMYAERALRHIAQAEAILHEYEKNPPKFDSDRVVPRTRRKLPRAKDDAELDQVWRCQVEDMLLSEVCRRENVARLAAEKGKPDPNAKEPSPTAKILARLKRVRMEVQEADEEDMVTHLLNAVAHVYDPHSDYMGAREEKQFKDMIKASLVGIGAQLREDDDGSTKIEGIVKGGPADKNGQLKLGDHVVAVDTNGDGNWTDILFMSIDKVVNLIRGKKDVPVRLRVQSAESGDERIITIVRDEVPMSESLAGARIVDLHEQGPQGEVRTYRLGILTLPSFYVDIDGGNVHCATDVRRILARMVREKVQGLVLDLRTNGGGSLEEVRKMVGFFTGAGPVVQVKDARGQVERLTVSGKPIFHGDLVVLTSKASASASEIFAGAMKDYGRAVIVGDDTTFGKGTVQVPRSLADYMPFFSAREGCGLIKVTVQKFYRINGASTQLKGVSSDIELPTVTSGMQIGEAEMDHAMPYDAIAKAGGYVCGTHTSAILPRLRELSAARVAKDEDLQNNVWYANYRRRIIKENSYSLNKEKRQAQIAELRDFKKKSDATRKQRYEAMSKDDASKLTIYRLKLTDLDKGELPLATKEDKDNFMREAKDPEEELEDNLDYPSDLDPVLREALYITRDMIDLR